MPIEVHKDMKLPPYKIVNTIESVTGVISLAEFFEKTNKMQP